VPVAHQQRARLQVQSAVVHRHQLAVRDGDADGQRPTTGGALGEAPTLLDAVGRRFDDLFEAASRDPHLVVARRTKLRFTALQRCPPAQQRRRAELNLRANHRGGAAGLMPWGEGEALRIHRRLERGAR
jgi:hypothetical protein